MVLFSLPFKYIIYSIPNNNDNMCPNANTWWGGGGALTSMSQQQGHQRKETLGSFDFSPKHGPP